MHRSIAWGSLMAALMMALAGCTGEFEVDQTEPFQVDINGEPQTVTVREDSKAQRVTVETADVQTETIEVEVTVTKLTEGPCTVHVTIEGSDGEPLAEEDIEVGGNETENDGNETGDDGNMTEDDSMEGDTTIVENIVVNVKGKDNVVVITQAQQGDAEVNIAAREGMANQDGNQTVDDTDDGPY